MPNTPMGYLYIAMMPLAGLAMIRGAPRQKEEREPRVRPDAYPEKRRRHGKELSLGIVAIVSPQQTDQLPEVRPNPCVGGMVMTDADASGHCRHVAETSRNFGGPKQR